MKKMQNYIRILNHVLKWCADKEV